MIVLALVRRFPYHLFRKTHNWLAIAYLALVFHSFVLTRFEYWFQPVGWILTVLMLVGTMSAVRALTGRIGRGRKVKGTIESLQYYPELQVIEGALAIDSGWKGHRPGQFAFVTSSKREGAHPYTIASAWGPDDRRLTFITKALGDWTGQLHRWLKVGTPVIVEGPYGCFDFNDGCARQIWVGAGIGITPFIARMKHLANSPDDKEIDLYHPTKEYNQVAIEKLTSDAKAAGIRLHLWVTPREGRLTPERIREDIPNWRSVSVWFCGPAKFGDILRKDFVATGLASTNFHQELFEMR